MTMYNTLLLDTVAWDLVLDSNGNIAMASPPYALAQDVASQVRLFLGELYYDQTQGIPYFQEVLGQLPPSSLLTGLIEKQALMVSGVVTAQCTLTGFVDGVVTGQVLFTDESGVTTSVQFTEPVTNPAIESAIYMNGELIGYSTGTTTVNGSI